jgi:hypothetical protein
LFRIVTDFYRRLGSPLLQRQTAEELQLTNFSRIVCLPCREETIRGYSHVTLLVIDEAALVPDDLYRAVCPMLAVSNGRLICLSTPRGKRGFFHDAWARGGDDWARIEVPAERIPRISAEFLARERRGMSESWYRQEYCCSFEALQGLVYPDFARCVVHALPADLRQADVPSPLSPVPRAEVPSSLPPLSPEYLREVSGLRGVRRVGGIDFGFRNPFAAVWGFVDGDGVLWLTGEHYSRQKPLSYHARHLPRGVKWYADPAGASECCELRCAGFTVAKGDNALRPGIAAVSARVENGTLRVLEGCCPNLLYEAALYRYSDEPGERNAEVPVDEHNHALAALRYLISRLDARQMARNRHGPGAAAAPDTTPDAVPPSRGKRPWLRLDNEQLWTPLL